MQHGRVGIAAGADVGSQSVRAGSVEDPRPERHRRRLIMCRHFPSASIELKDSPSSRTLITIS